MKQQHSSALRSVGLAALIVLASATTALAQSTASIRGTITDERTNNLLPGAEVVLEGTPYRASSGSDGRYRLNAVPQGTYTLTVSYVGYQSYSHEITVDESGIVRYPIGLVRSSRIADEIVVEGARFGQSKALNDQKEAANIKNIISEEQIQSFPDLNTAEVLQRVPGISIQKSMGEGRFVSMRGTPSSMTSVTVNGQQVAFSNESNRSVELDVVSAAQLTGIEVTKVLTPDMDADAVGGAINLKTRSAFDQEERILNGTVGLGTHSIADGTHSRASFNYADVLGPSRKLGLAVGLNYARTAGERHNNEQRWGDREDQLGNEIPYALRNTEVQFSDNVRDRYGLNTRLEYRINEDHRLYVSGVYNYREDDQNRQITRVRWDRGEYVSPTEVQDLRILKSLHDRLEEQEITSFSLGGDHQLGRAVVDFQVSRSSASTKKPEGQLQPEFELRGVNLNMVDVDTVAPKWESPDGFDIHDSDNYALDVADFRYTSTTSDIDSFSANVTYPMTLGSDSGEFKTGVKVRALAKDRADVRSQWRWEGADDLLLSQFRSGATTLLENGYNLGDEYDRGAFRDFFFANQGPDALSDEQRIDVNLGEPYDADEDVTSVYVMTSQNYGNLLVLGGVRAEFTELDYTATNLVMNDDTFVSNTTENVKRDYDYLFPNLQFRYRLTPDTNVRLAYSKGLSRPDFFDSMPYSSIQMDGEQITRGNPHLKPAVSHNFDLLGEHFFEGIGLLSGGVFYKQLEDFNFETSQIEIGGPWDGYEVEQYVNGGGADVYGVEINWQQQFTFLPGWMSGLGIFANYTYTDSSNIDLGDDTDRVNIAALPEQMQHVGNLSLSYEKDGIISRLAANYSGKYIEEVGGEPESDEWRDAATTLDFSFTYMFENGLDIFFQANNLTDEVKYVYYGVPSRSTEYTITGRSFNIGMRLVL